MIFLFALMALSVVAAGVGAVALRRPAPAAAAPVSVPVDDRSATLARIRRVGIAPDDLRNVHLR